MLSVLSTVDPQKLFLAGAVVQATFAMTLALLAWADRRTHGMFWLAAGGALEFFSTFFRLWRGFQNSSVWDIPSAALLLATVLLMYRGLRWFTVRREIESQRWPLTLGAVAITGLLLGIVAPIYGLVLLRIATVGAMGVICHILWKTRIVELQRIARVSAVLCGMVITVMITRILLTLQVSAISQTSSTLLGREATLVLMTVLEFSFIGLFVAESNRRLHEETRVDALTGLRNRRSIEETAVDAVSAAHATGRPLALLMLDLDHFKDLNDTWGHAVGDRALRAVSGALLNVVGVSESVARLGGEEFAVLLPDCTAPSAAVLAERLRGEIEGLRLNENGKTVTVTASIGISTWKAGELDWNPLLKRADDALYRAKAEGRNRVALCNESAQPIRTITASETSWWRRALSGRGPVL